MKKLIMLVCISLLLVGSAVQSYALSIDNGIVGSGRVTFNVDATGVTSATYSADVLAIEYAYVLCYKDLAGTKYTRWLGAGPLHSTTNPEYITVNKAVKVVDYFKIGAVDAYLQVDFTLAAGKDYLQALAAFNVLGTTAVTATDVKGYWVLSTPNTNWQVEDATPATSQWDMINSMPVGPDSTRKVLSAAVDSYNVGFFADIKKDDYQAGSNVLARVNAGSSLKSHYDLPNAISNPATMGAILDPSTGQTLQNVPSQFQSSSRLEMNYVPEPCTMALIATGLFGLVGMRRRKIQG